MRVNYYFEYDGRYNFNYLECNYDMLISSLIDEIIKIPQEIYDDTIFLTDIKAAYLRDQKLDLKEKIGKYSTELKNNYLYLSDGSNGGHEYNLRDIRINFNDYEIGEKFHDDYFSAIEKSTNKKVLISLSASDLESFPHYYLYSRIRGFDFSRGIDLPGFVKPIGFGYTLTDKEKEKAKLLEKQMIVGDPRDLIKYNIGSGPTFVFEYIKNGPAYSKIINYLKTNGENQSEMNPTIRSKIIFGVASSMKKLHQRGFIHRNLKLQQIYLDENFEPKIAGYEFLTILKNNNNTLGAIGTDLYMAPEVFMDGDEEYGTAADVFSYGMLLYIMFCDDPRFEHNKGVRSGLQFRINIGRGRRPLRPENIPDHIWDLINKCWDQNPLKRPTFAEITEILKDDKFALKEFGVKTDLKVLHEYQQRMEEEEFSNMKKSRHEKKQISKTSKHEYKEDQKSKKHKKSKEDKESTKSKVGKKDKNYFFGADDAEYHEYIKKVGEGATSITYEIKDKRTNKLMCKKIFKINQKNFDSSFKNIKNALKEFEILIGIHHPCICKAIAINLSEPVEDSKIKYDKEVTTVSILLEYIDYDIKDVFNVLNGTFKTRIVIEIVHAMKFIHSLGLIHRDLKIENIRLNAVFNAKIIDFGLVRIFECLSKNYSFVSDSLTKGVGTFAYMSPEMLNEEDYDYKTDVYSFGVVVYYLFVGSLPKQKLKDKMASKKIALPEESSSISQCCIDLIEKCLSEDQDERPTFKEILKYLRNHSYSLSSDVDQEIIANRDKELDLIKS